MERYIVQPEDLKGEIADFPIEVVQRMIDCQVEQGHEANVEIFQKDKRDGFLWDRTSEGDSFWEEVIINKVFNLFFKQYPREEVRYCTDIFRTKTPRKFLPNINENKKQHEPSLYTAISEAVKSVVNADTSVELEEKDGTIVIRAVKNKKEDLPIDTPVMVNENITERAWVLNYYKGNGYTTINKDEIKNTNNSPYPWECIIPFDKFNPNDIEESLKYNIVK